MSTFVAGPVTVSVPATSANLGPGFDCLGLALSLNDHLTCEVVADGGVTIEIEGEGVDTLPRDDFHLVVRAMKVAFEAAGVDPPGLDLRCTNRIPQARGLGSSSGAIVGGLVLARALLSDPTMLSDQVLLRLATEMEGHPDNVAPAMLGGLVVCGQDDGDVWAVHPQLDPAIRAVAFVPQDGVATEAARGLLPETVPHRDAAANSGRAALLIAALAGATGELLRATEDRLHQRYRASAMPASFSLMTELRERGHAAVISGAGPTVLVLTADDPHDLVGFRPDGWMAAILDVDHLGARVVAP